MSKEEYLKELLKWVSTESIMVIDGSGKLRTLYCPFRVVCLVNFPDITRGERVSVDAVKLTMEIKEVFIIRGVAYYIVYFRILPDS